MNDVRVFFLSLVGSDVQWSLECLKTAHGLYMEDHTDSLLFSTCEHEHLLQSMYLLMISASSRQPPTKLRTDGRAWPACFAAAHNRTQVCAWGAHLPWRLGADHQWLDSSTRCSEFPRERGASSSRASEKAAHKRSPSKQLVSKNSLAQLEARRNRVLNKPRINPYFLKSESKLAVKLPFDVRTCPQVEANGRSPDVYLPPVLDKNVATADTGHVFIILRHMRLDFHRALWRTAYAHALPDGF
ncbi:hypothetical protein CYMTET_5701 [Cymbomonas tetramitiformis]|uniref:Uncharacterized protein n=1 Tax=Cymbomonas tetramitiformis TaxID=36881 RepID=A0AAE0GYN2_9CHLO|nr:hypothetical protein CYMTET_5701 [Cymbomonas tetramitiformis]